MVIIDHNHEYFEHIFDRKMTLAQSPKVAVLCPVKLNQPICKMNYLVNTSDPGPIPNQELDLSR